MGNVGIFIAYFMLLVLAVMGALQIPNWNADVVNEYSKDDNTCVHVPVEGEWDCSLFICENPRTVSISSHGDCPGELYKFKEGKVYKAVPAE